MNAKTEQLNKKLDALCSRAGLEDHPELQACLRRHGHIIFDILQEQVNTIRREKHLPRLTDGTGNGTGAAPVAVLSHYEHRARIDLHVVQWSNEAKKEIAAFGEALAAYKQSYLLPTLKTYGRSDNPDTEAVADYLLGSVIRPAIDLLGKEKCYVPDSQDTQGFANELRRHQRMIHDLQRSGKLTGRYSQ